MNQKKPDFKSGWYTYGLARLITRNWRMVRSVTRKREDLWTRPADHFLGWVELDGQVMKRFTEIG